MIKIKNAKVYGMKKKEINIHSILKMSDIKSMEQKVVIFIDFTLYESFIYTNIMFIRGRYLFSYETNRFLHPHINRFR